MFFFFFFPYFLSIFHILGVLYSSGAWDCAVVVIPAVQHSSKLHHENKVTDAYFVFLLHLTFFSLFSNTNTNNTLL